ncbi:hypothetical protein ACTXI9_01535 [Brachybacterium alimentarium]|uniref:hypothetical protein n=1 Tax=Brachybacterium alimentarium TaxID=47845 RepID=UPI003FCF8DDB
MQEYIVTRGGVQLTVKLSPETAKRLKARPVQVPEADSPADELKTRAPRNKGRTPANKSK